MLGVISRILLPMLLAVVPASAIAQLQYEVPANAEDEQWVPFEQFVAPPYTPGDVSRFMFADWSGPAIPVWTYVPAGIDVTQAPIMFMMHGAKRNPARYLLEWVPYAQRFGIVVIAPEFSRRDFRGSGRYNRGNVSYNKDGEYIPVDQSEWSFSAIEPLFDHAVAALDSQQTQYTLYGHSAGAQFSHRFLFHLPSARIQRMLIANAGWYTMPDPLEAYPYGLRDSGISKDALKRAFRTPVVILLGDKDIETQSGSLSRTEGALRQGAHRYSRGLRFLASASEQAAKLGVDLHWQIERVEGVGHSNSQMAQAAAPFVK